MRGMRFSDLLTRSWQTRFQNQKTYYTVRDKNGIFDCKECEPGKNMPDLHLYSRL